MVEIRKTRRDHTELQTLQIKHSLTHHDEIARIKSDLVAETRERVNAERERDEYKLRYEQMVKTFMSLGLEVPSGL